MLQCYARNSTTSLPQGVATSHSIVATTRAVCTTSQSITTTFKSPQRPEADRPRRWGHCREVGLTRETRDPRMWETRKPHTRCGATRPVRLFGDGVVLLLHFVHLQQPRTFRGAGAASHREPSPDMPLRPELHPLATAGPRFVPQWGALQERCRRVRPRQATPSSCRSSCN